MIKTTVRALLGAKGIMQSLATTEMPAKQAFQTMKILREVDKEYEVIHETRYNLINKYADKDENGQLKIDENGNINVAAEQIAAFSQEEREFLDSEIEINCNKLDAEIVANLQISPKMVLDLEDFIEFE